MAIQVGAWVVAFFVVVGTIGAATGAGKKSNADLAATSQNTPASTTIAPQTPVAPTTVAPTTVAPEATVAPPTSVAPATTAPSAVAASSEAPGTCRVRGSGLDVLPDPACTPGVTNPDVSQANIASTICASGWTSTIRPPESYTEPLKIQQMAAYGDTGSVSSYEEDHLVSLELGGSPRDPRNLWPEPGASPNSKDKVENAARRAVCSGQMSLAVAQAGIAANWIALGERLGVTTATTPATTPATAATTTPTAPPPTSPPTAPAGGCSPRTSSGNCYKAGEYCPSADHSMTGTDANGNTITCEDVNGSWRWEH